MSTYYAGTWAGCDPAQYLGEPDAPLIRDGCFTRKAALAAVQRALEAQQISTEHGPWRASNLHEGESYCTRCFVRSVFRDKKTCEPHIRAAPQQAAPAAAPASGEVVVTRNEAGQIVAVTRQDADGRVLSVIAESAPAVPASCPTHQTASGDHTACRRCNESWPTGQDRACVKAFGILRKAAS